MSIPSPIQRNGDDFTSDPKDPSSRNLTPGNPGKVRYLNFRGKAKPRNAERPPKRISHAKRADQFGILLLACSLFVIAIVVAAIYFNQQRYLYQTSQTNETSTAALDFYRGDRTFSEKVAEERAAQQEKKGHEVHGLSSVNDDLEVSLAEQMNSMSETMKKMRQEQQSEELPAPTKDTGYKSDIIPPKPTKSQNFQVPKVLQNP